MICPECGNSVPEGAKFCAACGHRIAPFAADPGLRAERPFPAENSSKAIVSLVLGIVPLSVISSIPAVVFGHLALAEIKQSGGRLAGKGIAVAGLVLGYVGIALVPLILIVAAIVIPKHARIPRNERNAVSAIRAVVAAQVFYQSKYPSLGFAPDLSSLGPGEAGCATPSPTNACLIDGSLAAASLPPGKNGYIFVVRANASRKNFLVSAMPIVRNQTGVRSFCAADDGEVHLDLSGGAIENLSDCAKLPNLE